MNFSKRKEDERWYTAIAPWYALLGTLKELQRVLANIL